MVTKAGINIGEQSLGMTLQAEEQQVFKESERLSQICVNVLNNRVRL
jgi:hypothetical protein